MNSPVQRGHGESTAAKLNALLTAFALPELAPQPASRFGTYLELLLRWNARINLTAIRDPVEILRRHFLESIACAAAIPAAVHTLLDFGSGAGFPGIPIALCRPAIAVTLAESQSKKAAFLSEAVRSLGLATQVHSGRAETLGRTFDCVTLRAVDRMEDALHAAARLVAPGGWLAPLTTVTDAIRLQSIAGSALSWQPPIPLPGSSERILLLGSRQS